MGADAVVGKTSMAATMGVHAALMGRKVLVLTIDPAGVVFGITRNSVTKRNLPIDLSMAGETGELWAMMLDNRDKPFMN